MASAPYVSKAFWPLEIWFRQAQQGVEAGVEGGDEAPVDSRGRGGGSASAV
jgi:hypothetical protein